MDHFVAIVDYPLSCRLCIIDKRGESLQIIHIYPIRDDKTMNQRPQGGGMGMAPLRGRNHALLVVADLCRESVKFT
jgi:hypothetical protein